MKPPISENDGTSVVPSDKSSCDPSRRDFQPSQYRLVPSYRLAISFMCFLLRCELLMLRVNMSMALVCMVRPIQFDDHKQITGNWSNLIGVNNSLDNTNTTPLIDVVTDRLLMSSHDQNSTSSLPRHKEEFLWSKQLQGLILSSFFFGYLATQMLGGWLCGRFGAKNVAGTGMLISVAATVLIPAAARASPYWVIVLRILIGLASGVLLTSVHSLLGLWAPPRERTVMTAIAAGGVSVGSIAVMLVTPHLCVLEADNGWPLIFYVTGGFGFLVWILWNVIVYSAPALHPWISQDELRYIELMTGRTVEPNRQQPRSSFPWFKAVTSPAVLACCAGNVAQTWFTYTSSTTFPMYMNDVLRLSIKENGFYLMLPYPIILLLCTPTGLLADILIRRSILGTTVVRKLFQCSACFICGCLLLGMSFFDHRLRYAAIIVNIVQSVLIDVLSQASALVNVQDLAPRYAGEVFGIVNSASTFTGIIAPLVVSALTPNGTAEEWKNVFYVSCTVLWSGGLVFAIFAKGTVLVWAQQLDDYDPQIVEVALKHDEDGIKYQSSAE